MVKTATVELVLELIENGTMHYFSKATQFLKYSNFDPSNT